MGTSTDQLTVLDLFAGVGGFSHGFHHCFKVMGAIEKEPPHAGTYQVNFPQTPVICASVCQITGDWIRSKWGTPTIVVGGPPCQSFSIQGRRDKEDARAKLLFEFARITLELRPCYFVLENVRGLVQGDMREVFNELCDRLSHVYTLSHKVLNAANFGVPQDRERVFLFGALPDYPLPPFPVPNPLWSWVTVREAFEDLPDVEQYEELFHLDYLDYAEMQEPKSNYAILMRRENLDYLTGLGRTRHRQDVIERFRDTPLGEKEKISRFWKLDPDDVAPTLLAGGSDRSRTPVRPIDPFRNRVITVRQAARLSSFPDDFRFHHSKVMALKQIGNAVPPLLSKAIATEFAKVIG